MISGIERMMDSRGQPIAPDFDLLIHLLASKNAARSGFSVVLVGTNDCWSYFERRFSGLGPRVWRPVKWPLEGPSGSSELEAGPGERWGLLAHLDFKVRDANIPHVRGSKSRSNQFEVAQVQDTNALSPNSPRSHALQTMLRLVLDRWHELAFSNLEPSNRTKAELDKEILGALAFVATPIEIEFVRHLTPIQSLLATLSKKTNEAAVLEESIKRLSDWGLVRRIVRSTDGGQPSSQPTAGPPEPARVVLHRSVLAELRERFGIRSGDSLLSNSFGLTTAVSMPADLAVPDWDIHLKLKATVGRLRGAWRDIDLQVLQVPGADSVATVLASLRETIASAEESFDDKRIVASDDLASLARFICIGFAPMGVTLRAAVAVVRGYLSAAALVAQASPDGARRIDGEPGEFGQHRAQLRALVESLIENQNALPRAVEIISKIQKVIYCR